MLAIRRARPFGRYWVGFFTRALARVSSRAASVHSAILLRCGPEWSAFRIQERLHSRAIQPPAPGGDVRQRQFLKPGPDIFSLLAKNLVDGWPRYATLAGTPPGARSKQTLHTFRGFNPGARTLVTSS